MKNPPCWILSPCGTSLLTNVAGSDRGLVARYANAKHEADIPADDLAVLRRVIETATRTLTDANPAQAAKASAELNGITRLYGGVLPQRQDFHYLLCTDTFLGETTGRLVGDWLTRNGKEMVVEVDRHTDLQTDDIQAFQASLSDLVEKLSTTVPGYRQSGYRTIFNLTGGFKSVQGFLQSIANFYADETIYIFESSEHLLRIPRLPLRLDAREVVETNLEAFRRLSLGLGGVDTHAIPETLLFEVGGQVSLSAWGELVWKESRHALYQEKLFAPPTPRIKYSPEFEEQVNELPPDRIAHINERVDQLARHLHKSNYNPRSLDFKELSSNVKAPATHELDAWADGSAQRVFGYFQKGVFVLHRLGDGLH